MDIPFVAATPRPRRGYSVRRGGAAAERFKFGRDRRARLRYVFLTGRKVEDEILEVLERIRLDKSTIDEWRWKVWETPSAYAGFAVERYSIHAGACVDPKLMMNRRVTSGGGILSVRLKLFKVVVMWRPPQPGDVLMPETLRRATSAAPPTMSAVELAALAAATATTKMPTTPVAGDLTFNLTKAKKPPPKRKFSKVARSRGACGGAVDRVTWKIKSRGTWTLREWRRSPKGPWLFKRELLWSSVAKARKHVEKAVREKKNQKGAYVEA